MAGLYDDILLPTDGAEEMGPVLDHARELAQIHDATVHVLYVVDAATFSDLPMETSYESIRTLLEEEGETAVAEAEQRLEDVPLETTIVEGSPRREILARASESDCDLIVMGTHGRGGLDRLLLGSVAESVVRAAEVPVLTVHVELD